MARQRSQLVLLVLLVLSLALAPLSARAAGGRFIGQFGTVSPGPSTVPGNGDINPYGVAVVRRSVGKLVSGAVLVSNFNDTGNAQGTGTTIVEVAPNGTTSLFAQIDAATLPGSCPGGVGLSTALVVLRNGWVIVGSLPTTDGTATTAQSGCLIVLDSQGTVVSTIAGPLINGPWDMTALDRTAPVPDDTGSAALAAPLGISAHAFDGFAVLFVTNVLNGTLAGNGNQVNGGTVVRIFLAFQNNRAPQVLQETVIGSGFPERTDPSALVIGPTGVGLSGGGDGEVANGLEGLGTTLYVADSLNNRIAAIPDAISRQSSAGTGRTVTMGGALNDPLGLAVAPNDDILTVNGNDGNIVETTPSGVQVATKLLDSTVSPGPPPSLPGAGTLFGIAIVPNGSGVYFVDDGSNTLNLLH